VRLVFCGTASFAVPSLRATAARHEVAAVVTEDPATFARLAAPVKRVCALQVPIPYSPVLEDHVFPDRARIIAGVRAVLEARKPAAAA